MLDTVRSVNGILWEGAKCEIMSLGLLVSAFRHPQRTVENVPLHTKDALLSQYY